MRPRKLRTAQPLRLNHAEVKSSRSPGGTLERTPKMQDVPEPEAEPQIETIEDTKRSDVQPTVLDEATPGAREMQKPATTTCVTKANDTTKAKATNKTKSKTKVEGAKKKAKMPKVKFEGEKSNVEERPGDDANDEESDDEEEAEDEAEEEVDEEDDGEDEPDEEEDEDQESHADEDGEEEEEEDEEEESDDEQVKSEKVGKPPKKKGREKKKKKS